MLLYIFPTVMVGVLVVVVLVNLIDWEMEKLESEVGGGGGGEDGGKMEGWGGAGGWIGDLSIQVSQTPAGYYVRRISPKSENHGFSSETSTHGT